MTKWKLVPAEPTREMLYSMALSERHDHGLDSPERQSMRERWMAQVYAGMLAAAPLPPRLTDDEISDICNEVDHTHGGTDEWVGVFARAIEARVRGDEHEQA